MAEFMKYLHSRMYALTAPGEKNAHDETWCRKKHY